jgi:small ligand-binding sensory domain FIST
VPRFVVGHATHPDWQGALALAAAQIDGQRDGGTASLPQTGSLGLAYFSDHFAPQAEALHEALRARWPGVVWAGTVGIGVCASGVEYFDEPALVVMLTDLAPAHFRIFSGAQPLGGFEPACALVHADARTHDLAELLDDLSARTRSGYLFGGVAASRTRSCQIADGVFEGGLSGVAFSHDLALVSRVTQGCRPIGPQRRITGGARNLVTELDGRPALQCLLDDLKLSLDDPRQVMQSLRETLAGLVAPQGAITTAGSAPAAQRHGAFGAEVRVRHLVGLDPARHGVAVADVVQPGMALAFCQRDVEAARRDLTRICAEIRDELAPVSDAVGDSADEVPAQIRGALYFSCVGRGGPHFGAASAELQLIRHALGDVPLAGFFAAGEIAHRQLYGYTGVLTVFTD